MEERDRHGARDKKDRQRHRNRHGARDRDKHKMACNGIQIHTRRERGKCLVDTAILASEIILISNPISLTLRRMQPAEHGDTALRTFIRRNPRKMRLAEHVDTTLRTDGSIVSGSAATTGVGVNMDGSRRQLTAVERAGGVGLAVRVFAVGGARKYNSPHRQQCRQWIGGRHMCLCRGRRRRWQSTAVQRAAGGGADGHSSAHQWQCRQWSGCRHVCLGWWRQRRWQSMAV